MEAGADVRAGRDSVGVPPSVMQYWRGFEEGPVSSGAQTAGAGAPAAMGGAADPLGVAGRAPIDWLAGVDAPGEDARVGAVLRRAKQEEQAVRLAYTNYLDAVLSLTTCGPESQSAVAEVYAALCSPGLVVSLDGFSQGQGSEWRRSAGLHSSITLAESELRGIAQAELCSLNQALAC